jgi:hypothetical protein
VAEGREAAEGARLVTQRGLRFFFILAMPGHEDVRASGRVGRPDGSIYKEQANHHIP